MKKLVMVAMLMLAALGLLAGCNGDAPADDKNVVGANNIGEFAWVADLEAAFGHNIADFGDNNTEGYKATEFNLVSSEYPVAEITYTKGDNMIVVSTACTKDGNVSGFDASGDIKEYESNGAAVTYAMLDDDTYMAYWVQGGYSYSIYETEEMEETFFKVLVDYLTAEVEAADETDDKE